MSKQWLTAAVMGIAAFPAWACPTCQCGDYTLTLMGVEKLYAGRLRVAADYINRSEHVGAGDERELLQENRYVLGFSYGVSQDLSVALRTPISSKSAASAEESERASGLGDLDLTAKYTLGRIGDVTARHLWGLTGGVRIPSSSEQKNSDGEAVDIDAQPGTGQWAPSAGLWYGYFHYPRMVYASVSVSDPVGTGYQGLQQGTTLLATVTAQHALTQQWTLQLGLEGRSADYNRFDGVRDDDSGGAAAFVAPAVLWAPTTSWLVYLSGQVPIVRHLYGAQEERGDVRIGVAYDIPTT